jgi:hypothetical protein
MTQTIKVAGIEGHLNLPNPRDRRVAKRIRILAQGNIAIGGIVGGDRILRRGEEILVRRRRWGWEEVSEHDEAFRFVVGLIAVAAVVILLAALGGSQYQ